MTERGTIVFLRVRIITLGGSEDVVADNAFERRLGRHGDHGFDRAAVDRLADDEAIVEPVEHVARPRRRFGLALDLQLLAPRGDIDAEPVLDGDQILVIFAEQGTKQIGLVESQFEPGALAGLRLDMTLSHVANHTGDSLRWARRELMSSRAYMPERTGGGQARYGRAARFVTAAQIGAADWLSRQLSASSQRVGSTATSVMKSFAPPPMA